MGQPLFFRHNPISELPRLVIEASNLGLPQGEVWAVHV